MISVIIPTYNRAHLIQRAIESVEKQTYNDLEIIVVDDGSTDNTEEALKQLKYKNIRYIKLKENGGACKARNIGIALAKGEYVAFLDSDDEWQFDKLEKQYNFLIKNQAQIVTCNYWYVKGESKKLFIDSKHKAMIELHELLDKNCITTGAILVKKNFIKSLGGFDEKMPRYQDWEFVLRAAKFERIFLLNEPLLTLYFQEKSISNSTTMEKKYMALLRMYKKNKEEYHNNKKAYAHICWSLGMYSLYSDNIKIDLLKKGAFINGIDKKRLCIYALIRMKLNFLIKKMYKKNH
mgnify:CR=1 FL=1